MDLSKYIRDIPDFPKPGIIFKDITPILKAPEALSYVVDALAESLKQKEVAAIAAIEARGFIFGAPLALRLKLPFVPIRKSGKLPAESISVDYSLEYGSNKIEIHKDALSAAQAVVVIDDLLATGGTALAASKLVEELGAEVVKLLFVIELGFLGGRQKLSNYEVSSLLCFS